MVDLSHVGITNTANIYHNLSTPALYEEAVKRGEAEVGHLGPLVVSTGKYTGRSANDKFIVREPSSQDRIWWGEVNRPFERDDFDKVLYGLRSYLQGRDVFVQDCYAGADPDYRIKVRVITEHAWHNMFARNMFLREFDEDMLSQFVPDYTVVHCPDFHADPAEEHTHSEAFILLNTEERLVIIGGTSYAGEIKKSIFTVMNYLLPQQGVLSLHSSANVGADGVTAIFFGLSGTGKTTLSTEADRALIGDDEHGWSDRGVFNFEGGCYAKMIKLSDESEPEIYQTTRRFGTVLENVTIDPQTRRLDLDEARTENTRRAYPITHLDNVVLDGMGGHPKDILMLAADAFGVLPPIARLSPEQARYHFISGYTAKVAGTERGVKEPQATFSACFGAPFMPLHPTVYADPLGEKIADHDVQTWLVNMGWTGGPYGVGSRFKIAHSRAVVRAAISGALDDVPYRIDPVFGFEVPVECPGIPAELLDPRSTWGDPADYDAKAAELARLFVENFKDYADLAGAELVAGRAEHRLTRVRGTVATVCLVVLAAACGDSITDDTFIYPVDPRGAETCEELAEVAFDLVQLALDDAAGMSVAELQDPASGEAFRAQFAENGALVEFRRERMGCTQEEMDAYFCENVGDLRAAGAGAEFFLESMQSQVGCG